MKRKTFFAKQRSARKARKDKGTSSKKPEQSVSSSKAVTTEEAA